METLKDMLGTWKYERAGHVKYYRVVPSIHYDLYIITWGATAKEVVDHVGRLSVEADNALARLLAKQRGGFRLVEPYTGNFRPSALLSVVQSTEPEDDFNFWEWLGGRDYPEN
jgi:hypothetical protein